MAKLGLIFLTLTFDLWPWPLAWTSLLSLVITSENFMMIWWEEHCEKGVTDGWTDRQMDGQTDRSVLRAARSQLKAEIDLTCSNNTCVCNIWAYELINSLSNGTLATQGFRASTFILWTHCGIVTPIWQHSFGSTLAKVMACCLTAPSHFLH